MLLRERSLGRVGPPRSSSLAWRRRAGRIHLWAGLIMGPLVLVLGLSGAVLVFRAELQEAMDGPPALDAARAPASSLDAVVRAALVSHPTGEVRALRLPARPDRPYRVELYAGERRLDVAVDPHTMRVVGARAPERSILAAVQSLHGAFHAGRPGAVLVGLLGLGLFVESVTGLWLYGPLVVRRWRPWRRRPGRSLHRLVGAVSLVVGVIVGLTGALLALASAFAVAGAAPLPVPPGTGLASLDALAARADAALPGGRISAVVAGADHAVRVEKRLPRNGTGEREAWVLVDRHTRTILAVEIDPRRAGAWDVVRSLHAGDFAGS